MSQQLYPVSFIEEYKREHGYTLTFTVEEGIGSIYLHATGPLPGGRTFTTFDGTSKNGPFLRWRMRQAKRRIANRYRILCDIVTSNINNGNP